jgi:hypothetical protein
MINQVKISHKIIFTQYTTTCQVEKGLLKPFKKRIKINKLTILLTISKQ